jgi:hypothetical protein
LRQIHPPGGFLVEQGANLDVKSNKGFTPLDIATGNDRLRPAGSTDRTVALLRSLGRVKWYACLN